jgi:hypothetical protein
MSKSVSPNRIVPFKVSLMETRPEENNSRGFLGTGGNTDVDVAQLKKAAKVQVGSSRTLSGTSGSDCDCSSLVFAASVGLLESYEFIDPSNPIESRFKSGDEEWDGVDQVGNLDHAPLLCNFQPIEEKSSESKYGDSNIGAVGEEIYPVSMAFCHCQSIVPPMYKTNDKVDNCACPEGKLESAEAPWQ